MAAPEDVRQDTVKDADTWGVRGKLTLQKGRWNWYGQGAYMGLVAEAGPLPGLGLIVTDVNPALVVVPGRDSMSPP